MPGAESAPPDPAIAGTTVPEPARIRDARALDVPASTDVSQEVTVLGISLATSWWGVLIGLYVYALPLILYTAWVSIALWDLVRQEAVPNHPRVLDAGRARGPARRADRVLRVRALPDPAIAPGDAGRRGGSRSTSRSPRWRSSWVRRPEGQGIGGPAM